MSAILKYFYGSPASQEPVKPVVREPKKVAKWYDKIKPDVETRAQKIA